MWNIGFYPDKFADVFLIYKVVMTSKQNSVAGAEILGAVAFSNR